MTAEEYVQKEAWKDIVVSKCLIHPSQNCKITRHGLYDRTIPKGAKIFRVLCHFEKITFSLLPDCFSSRLPGTLKELETAVLMVEESVKQDPSLSDEMLLSDEISLASLDISASAEELNVEQKLFDLAADYRWLRSRINYFRTILSAMIILFPELFGNCLPTLRSFRRILKNDQIILIKLRSIAESKIHIVPGPLGLNPGYQRIQDFARKPP